MKNTHRSAVSGKPGVGPAKRRVAERRHSDFRGVAMLIENELEKAEVVLNAKAITDKLQTMAENLAKVEADDLMPMLDAMRETFGPQQADGFNSAVTEKVRELMTAVKAAKDAIGNEIMRLEGEVTGEPMSDMAADDDSAAMPAMAGATDMDADDADEDDMPLGDEDEGEDQGEAGKVEVKKSGSDPFADLMKDLGGDQEGAAGRAKKESFTLRHRRAVVSERFNRSFDDFTGMAALTRSLEQASQLGPQVAAVVQKVRSVISAGKGARNLDDGLEGVFNAVTYTVKLASAGDRSTLLDMLDTFDEKFSGDNNAFDTEYFDALMAALRGLARAIMSAKTVRESSRVRANPLVGSRNPDGAVLEGFRRRLREGQRPRAALLSTARGFGIDAEDVLHVVREARRANGRPVTETVTDQRKAELKKMGYAVNTDGKGHRWTKPKPGTTTNAEEMRAPPARDENAAWMALDKHVKGAVAKAATTGSPMREAKKHAKKPDADKDGIPDWADKRPNKKAPAFVDRKMDEAKGKKKKKADDGPCWDGYEMVGTKKKGGREVPNCVPESHGMLDHLAKHVKNAALDAGIRVRYSGSEVYVANDADARKLRSALASNSMLHGLVVRVDPTFF